MCHGAAMLSPCYALAVGGPTLPKVPLHKGWEELLGARGEKKEWRRQRKPHHATLAEGLDPAGIQAYRCLSLQGCP